MVKKIVGKKPGLGLRPLYLTLTIGPLGFSMAEIQLTGGKPDPYAVTKGEGQALVFKHIGGDYSTEFAEALRKGQVVQAIGQRWHKVKLRVNYGSPGKERIVE